MTVWTYLIFDMDLLDMNYKLLCVNLLMPGLHQITTNLGPIYKLKILDYLAS